MEVNFLNIEEVKLIHFDQIRRYGGLDGLRDEKLLDSAINYPKVTFQNKFLHCDLYHMASAYMYALIKNHPFLDGNKRTGLTVALLFLRYNDISIEATDDELFTITTKVAQSKIKQEDIAIFFKQKSIKH